MSTRSSSRSWTSGTGRKPVMVDFWPRPERTYPDLILQKMRPGDIHTHVYAQQFPILDERNRPQAGHGGLLAAPGADVSGPDPPEDAARRHSHACLRAAVPDPGRAEQAASRSWWTSGRARSGRIRT